MRLLFCVTLLAFTLGLGTPSLAGFYMPKGIILKPDLMAEQPEPLLLNTPEPSVMVTPSIPIQIVEQAEGQVVEKPIIAEPPASLLISAPESNVVLANRVTDEPIAARPVIIPARPSMPRRNNSYIVDFEEYKVLNQDIGAYGPKGMYGSPVPEPGSLLALSGGIIGLIFQANRARKRSH